MSVSEPTSSIPENVTLAQAFRVWLRIALLSFGGPAGQIATMHRILVEEKHWISDARFLHALNYCMLLPGPEAQQLATYIGWLMHRTRGGLMAGLLFIAPGMIAIMALSMIYVSFGKLGPVNALFFGLKAAVLAIVVEAVIRIGKRALQNRVRIALAALSFIGIFFFSLPFPLIILLAGVIGLVATRAGSVAFTPAVLSQGQSDELDVHARSENAKPLKTLLIWGAIWLLPVAALCVGLGTGHVFSTIALFFSKMAMVTFGGAYAVLAYVAQQAVENYHWLQPGEMLDGLGMAETTPGPLIMVLQYVGFLAAYRTPGALPPMLAGALGGLIATFVTFAPCFLWIFLGAPYVERLRGHRPLTGALAGITAAVLGVILNLAIWFAIHVVFREVVAVRGFGFAFERPVWASVDVYALGLSVLAIILTFRVRLAMPLTLAICCGAGLALHLAGLV